MRFLQTSLWSSPKIVKSILSCYKHNKVRCMFHTCQLFPINSESLCFGRHTYSPSRFCRKWPYLPILRASSYLLLNHKKNPNISPMELIITCETCTSLLKKAVKNVVRWSENSVRFEKLASRWRKLCENSSHNVRYGIYAMKKMQFLIRIEITIL